MIQIAFFAYTILILFVNTAVAQKTSSLYERVDRKALAIPDSSTTTADGIARYIQRNFTTDNDKVRAAFVWIASNIRYDVANMFTIDFSQQRQDKIANALKTKMGICEAYAGLFQQLCAHMDIPSYVIEGYTKQNERTDLLPHGWCAARLDSNWYLFDPTWAAGYIDEQRFYKKLNNAYYHVKPSEFIKSHMPFDYLWQFLNYPISSADFANGKTSGGSAKTLFLFADSIKVHNSLTELQQMEAAARRMEQSGVTNSLIYDRLQRIKFACQQFRKAEVIDLYNSSVVHYNQSINLINDFINYRNQRFEPFKSDDEIKAMLDSAENKLLLTQSELNKISNDTKEVGSLVSELKKAVGEVSVKFLEQKDWLQEYLRKTRSGRKAMLVQRKITWFGIPLN